MCPTPPCPGGAAENNTWSAIEQSSATNDGRAIGWKVLGDLEGHRQVEGALCCKGTSKVSASEPFRWDLKGPWVDVRTVDAEDIIHSMAA